MQKLIRARKRFKGFTVGLDLHKKFIQYSVFDRQGNEIEGARLNSERKALRDFVGRWAKKGPVQVSLEACGTFIWVFDTLVEELGQERVHVAHALKVKAVMRSGEKSDETDAWWLAYLLWDGRLPEAFVAQGALRDLRVAGRELRYHTDARSDLLRRVHSHLAQEGLKLPSTWWTSKGKRLQARAVLRSVKGERGQAVRILYREILALSRVLKHWRKRVKELSEGFELLATIQREIPGVKTIVGGLVYGELGDPRRYHSEKAYAKATGMTPSNRGTGGKMEASMMSREGSAHARWAYTRAVIACLRCKQGSGAQVGAWVRQRCRYKPKRKVIVAAGRKLAEGVWRLCTWGEAFDLKKAFPARAG
jgi:transposase